MHTDWQALEQIDADSWEALCCAVPPEIAATLQLSVQRDGSVVSCQCLAADAPLGNRSIALGLAEPATPETVRQLTARFVGSGLKNFALQISPHARPAQLEEWLRDAGLVVRGHWVKLVRDACPVAPSPAGIAVQLVGPDDKTRFGEVSAQGFGRPPIIAYWMSATVGFPRWRHYLAFIDGQPAGAAAMYVDQGYAWLGIGSTLPEFRQRGVQRALIARRLSDGLAQGVRCFISETESHNVSCRNLMQAGFRIAYERPNYGIPLPAG